MSGMAHPRPTDPETLDPRRARSRDRLLDAVTELLATGGVEAVTVEAVTRRSGVARTTLYRNFGSSTELLSAAFERMIPPVEPAPQTGSLRERLIALVIRQAAVIEQAPMQWAIFAWLGLNPTAPPDAYSDVVPPAVQSLRARAVERYREPFDQFFDSPEASAQLHVPDRIFAGAQLLGPVMILRLIGSRTLTRTDCEKIVDDFLATHAATDSSQPIQAETVDP